MADNSKDIIIKSSVPGVFRLKEANENSAVGQLRDQIVQLQKQLSETTTSFGLEISRLNEEVVKLREEIVKTEKYRAKLTSLEDQLESSRLLAADLRKQYNKVTNEFLLEESRSSNKNSVTNNGTTKEVRTSRKKEMKVTIASKPAAKGRVYWGAKQASQSGTSTNGEAPIPVLKSAELYTELPKSQPILSSVVKDNNIDLLPIHKDIVDSIASHFQEQNTTECSLETFYPLARVSYADQDLYIGNYSLEEKAVFQSEEFKAYETSISDLGMMSGLILNSNLRKEIESELAKVSKRPSLSILDLTMDQAKELLKLIENQLDFYKLRQ